MVDLTRKIMADSAHCCDKIWNSNSESNILESRYRLTAAIISFISDEKKAHTNIFAH